MKAGDELKGYLQPLGPTCFGIGDCLECQLPDAGVFLNLEPLTGALLGVVVLREKLGITAILGGAMIIGSAVYFSWPTKAG